MNNFLFFLFRTDYKKHGFFKELILEAEFCTFFQKKKMLEKIITTHPELFPKLTTENAKTLVQRIWTIITDRNKLAHGSIFIDASQDKPILMYYENGRKELDLSPHFFEKFKARINFVLHELSLLIADLRDNPEVSLKKNGVEPVTPNL